MLWVVCNINKCMYVCSVLSDVCVYMQSVKTWLYRRTTSLCYAIYINIHAIECNTLTQYNIYNLQVCSVLIYNYMCLCNRLV